ncbi:hypothetical protein JB92DRAFT_182082 [Gautieria morchelliformis]|nr:hypothetical protein JB92DRAFT_182082 [Gautieria morchelliformis]
MPCANAKAAPDQNAPAHPEELTFTLSTNPPNPRTTFRQGDWICTSLTCAAHNFMRNTVCIGCGAPRPVAPSHSFSNPASSSQSVYNPHNSHSTGIAHPSGIHGGPAASHSLAQPWRTVSSPRFGGVPSSEFINVNGAPYAPEFKQPTFITPQTHATHGEAHTFIAPQTQTQGQGQGQPTFIPPSPLSAVSVSPQRALSRVSSLPSLLHGGGNSGASWPSGAGAGMGGNAGEQPMGSSASASNAGTSARLPPFSLSTRSFPQVFSQANKVTGTNANLGSSPTSASFSPTAPSFSPASLSPVTPSFPSNVLPSSVTAHPTLNQGTNGLLPPTTLSTILKLPSILTPSGRAFARGGRVQNVSPDPLTPCVMFWPDNEVWPERGQIRPAGGPLARVVQAEGVWAEVAEAGQGRPRWGEQGPPFRRF